MSSIFRFVPSSSAFPDLVSTVITICRGFAIRLRLGEPFDFFFERYESDSLIHRHVVGRKRNAGILADLYQLDPAEQLSMLAVSHLIQAAQWAIVTELITWGIRADWIITRLRPLSKTSTFQLLPAE